MTLKPKSLLSKKRVNKLSLPLSTQKSSDPPSEKICKIPLSQPPQSSCPKKDTLLTNFIKDLHHSKIPFQNPTSYPKPQSKESAHPPPNPQPHLSKVHLLSQVRPLTFII